MSNLFSAGFWFNPSPGTLGSVYLYVLIFLIALFIILAILSGILKRKAGVYSKLFGKILSFCSTNAAAGALLLFFSWELIPVLSSRFWYLAWLVSAGVWIFFIVKYAQALPEKKKEFEQKKEFEKYLPK